MPRELGIRRALYATTKGQAYTSQRPNANGPDNAPALPKGTDKDKDSRRTRRATVAAERSTIDKKKRRDRYRSYGTREEMEMRRTAWSLEQHSGLWDSQ
ncbi:hypothetical protein LTR08_003559 [Meristemomyces frigidus]|nr:hypothetical protein LTR08_003559 [Meristemomyces frigidus]